MDFLKHLKNLDKKFIYILSITILIIIHATLRFLQSEYLGFSVNPNHYWSALNFAAGKGLVNSGDFLNSSELKAFMEAPLFVVDLKLSTIPPIHNFMDYLIQNVGNEDYVVGSFFKLLIGIIWKIAGIKWHYIFYLNYFISLCALLTIIDISRMFSGRLAGFLTGLIYCLSAPEICTTALIGRDGMPLWFAIFLSWLIIKLFIVRTTQKNIILISSLIGLVLALAIQGRASNIYFIPLLLMFLGCYCLNSVFKNGTINKLQTLSSFKQTGIIFITASLIFLSSTTFFNKVLTTNTGTSSYTLMHAMFSGLSLNGYSPHQIRFDDQRIGLQALEYGNRTGKHLNPTYCSKEYNDCLKDLYLNIIKHFPSYYLELCNSFYSLAIKTLGHPEGFFVTKLNPETFSMIFSLNQDYFTSQGYKLFIFGILLGLLYYRKYFFTFILASFAIYNAFASIMQFHARHILMGHFAYYIFSGIVLAFLLTYGYKIVIRLFQIFTTFFDFNVLQPKISR